MTTTPGHWGCCHCIVQLHRCNLEELQSLQLFSEKDMKKKTIPMSAFLFSTKNDWNLTYTKHLNNCTSISKSISLPLKRWLIFNKQRKSSVSTASFTFFFFPSPNKVEVKLRFNVICFDRKIIFS